jgi:hypothetical protein
MFTLFEQPRMKSDLNKKLLQAFCLGCFFFLSKNSFAQEFPIPQTKNIIPPSPTSVQFERYGDYPVGTFTGVPDINIPIFTIKSGDLTLPISLNYHASGSRGDDVSGFVGYGWTLVAGGEMSRTIIGKPDDISQVAGTQSTLQITPENVSQLEQKIQTGGSYGPQWWKIYLNTMDHEYDLYSYNVLGKSGKFINNTLLGYSPIIVRPQYLQDENGVEYNFNDLEYQEYDDSYYNTGNFSFVSTMHLTGINSKTSAIGFTYQDGPNYTHYNTTDTFILDDFWFHNYNIYSAMSFEYSSYNSGGINNSSSLIRYNPHFVKSIVWAGGKIDFIEDNNTKMLSSIKIFDGSNALLKTITLNITPFPTAKTTTPDPTFRFKLASVSFNDALNNQVQTFKFNYINENEKDAVGDLWTNKNDYWGFYNGQTGHSGTNLSSYAYWTRDWNDHQNPIGDGKIKDPDLAYTMNYVLNKITYPTGGYTIFDYEGNRANIGYTNAAAGGLRVKRITNYNFDGKETTHKAYTYPVNGGYQEVAPSMDLYYYTQEGFTEQDPTQYTCRFRRTFLMADPMVDLSPQGGSVVYPSVSEDDGSMGTQYNYDFGNAYEYQTMNFPTAEAAGDGNGGPHHNKRFTTNYRPWNYGNLLSKITSGTSNGVGFSTTEENEYEEYSTGSIRDMKIERTGFATYVKNPLQYNIGGQPPTLDVSYPEANIVSDIRTYDEIHPDDYNISDHYYLCGGKRLKTSTTYYATTNSTNEIVSTKTYFYNNSSYPSIANTIVTTNSKGESIITQLKFPYDYPTTHPYDDMVSINQIAPAIEQTVTNTTLGKELLHSKNNYDYFWLIPNLWYPSGQARYIAPKTLQKSILGNALETEVNISDYDILGNIRQVTARDGIVTTYLYGYYGQYPVAKIIGKDYVTVSANISQSVLDNPSSDAVLRTHLNTLRTIFPDAQVSTYTYKSLVGMTSATDAKGQTSYYEYDNFQRLVNIKDQNGKILKHMDYHYQGQ